MQYAIELFFDKEMEEPELYKKEKVMKKVGNEFYYGTYTTYVFVDGDEDDDGGDDVGQDAAEAQQGQHHHSQTDHGGIDVEVFGDAAADAVDHLVLIGLVKLLVLHGVTPQR